jgi:hypothetical protein
VARKLEELKSGCMAKAFDDEPTFVLLARDPCAPAAIRAWINARIAIGFNMDTDDKIVEAEAMAQLMAEERDRWRAEKRQAALKTVQP